MKSTDMSLTSKLIVYESLTGKLQT